MSGPVKDRASVKTIHDDAKGQYARGLKRSNNNGVASAKPRVITGSDDATAHKAPPGAKPVGKEWDLNYDERDMNEGDSKG